MENDRSQKYYSRIKRIRSLIVAGYTIDQIKKECSFSNGDIEEFFYKLTEVVRAEKKNPIYTGVCFGSKRQAYYPPDMFSENNLVKLKHNYSFADLSDSERDIYSLLPCENIDWRGKIRSLKNK